jgi:hypothetical protein
MLEEIVFEALFTWEAMLEACAPASLQLFVKVPRASLTWLPIIEASEDAFLKLCAMEFWDALTWELSRVASAPTFANSLLALLTALRVMAISRKLTGQPPISPIQSLRKLWIRVREGVVGG